MRWRTEVKNGVMNIGTVTLSRETLTISCYCDRKWLRRKPQEMEPVSEDIAQLLWFVEPNSGRCIKRSFP